MEPKTIDKYSAKHKGQNLMNIMDYARVLLGSSSTEGKDDKEGKRY